MRNTIRRHRFDANEMTQQELADKAGVTRQAILSIESGKYNPSLELAFRIARAFGARIEDVFSWDEEDQ
ncbi:MAG TPA: helix-turn-helix transcriptional regulator [Treponemataceae bacterium]|nr:helix-turn-helix transcriptional regulator [Treponemataceae bacterium]